MNQKRFNTALQMIGVLIVVIVTALVPVDATVFQGVAQMQERFSERVLQENPLSQTGGIDVVRTIPILGDPLYSVLDWIQQNVPLIGGILSVPDLVVGTFQIIIWLLVATVVGYIAGRSTRTRGYGCFGNPIIGLIGLTVGSWFFNLAGLQRLADIPILGILLIGFLGAICFIFILRIVDTNFAR